MDYVIVKDKKKAKKISIITDGYLMHSKNKTFKIENTEISNITITNKKFIHPFVYKIVMKKYNKLIQILTDLLVSDDSGNASMEVLNMIEKFKQEIKNKYRSYLKRRELEEMATKLKFIEKQAKIKNEIFINSYFSEKTSNRSK